MKVSCRSDPATVRGEAARAADQGSRRGQDPADDRRGET